MTRVPRRITAFAIVLTLGGSASAACAGRQTQPAADPSTSTACTVETETRLAIATGNSTGVYYILGNAYAQQLSLATDGKLKATAAETGASVQNIQQLVAGQYQVAFSLFDTATDAVRAAGAFTTPQPIQALARIYDNSTHVVVRADSGISSVADMKGRRISTGSPKSGTEVIATRLLQAAGLNPDSDIAAQRLDLTKTVEGMKDGGIDGLVWSGGLPTPGITDLFTTQGAKVKFIDITPALPGMQQVNAAYQGSVIPASAYGTPGDVPTIVVPNVLLVRDDLPANVACVLTTTLLSKKDQLATANAAAKGISLDVARKTDPVPLSPGATTALNALGAK